MYLTIILWSLFVAYGHRRVALNSILHTFYTRQVKSSVHTVTRKEYPIYRVSPANMSSQNERSIMTNGSFIIKQNHCIGIHSTYISVSIGDINGLRNWDTVTEDDTVRKQYTLLPYPIVTEGEYLLEKKYYDTRQEIEPYTMHPPLVLESLNHFLYNGANDFTKEFRVLIAGGGTGGAVSFLSEQLNHTNSEVIYVDFSKVSMSFAQINVRIRRSNNTLWTTDWIEFIPRLGLGSFQLVQCTGVLHHLKNPHIGLNILKEVQSEGGGANFMVYGKYGRTGIYQIQGLLRLINKFENTIVSELANAKRVLEILPQQHWFFHILMMGDIAMGDSGIYDLLLHHRDMPFTSQSLNEWLNHGNLKLVDFSYPSDRIDMPLKYSITDSRIYRQLLQMNIVKQISISELISGTLSKHRIYVSRLYSSEASLERFDNVVYVYGSPLGFRNTISDKHNYKIVRNQTYVYAKLHQSSVDELTTDPQSFEGPIEHSHITILSWPKNGFSDFLISILTKKPNKPKGVHELITLFKKDTNSNLTMIQIKQLFKETFWYLKDSGIFLLKKKSVQNFPKTCCFNQFTVKGIVDDE